MMPSETADLLRRSLSELAWSQWAAIGVAAVGLRTTAPVDPEALLMATVSVGRWDARLFDEMIDWISVNAESLDGARLRRMLLVAKPRSRRLAMAVLQSAGVSIVSGGRLGRLEADVMAMESASGYGSEPVFPGAAPSPSYWAGADDTFATFGFLRTTPELRSMSQAPDGATPAGLRFGLRALVGVGARAETLTYLVTHEWAHGRLIAEHAAYNQSVVADYLTELHRAGLAERRARGRLAEYRLCSPLRSAFATTSGYVAWRDVWPALVALLEALVKPGSDEALWARLASELEAQRDALSAEGFAVEVPPLDGWAVRGTAVLEACVASVVARCAELAG